MIVTNGPTIIFVLVTCLFLYLVRIIGSFLFGQAGAMGSNPETYLGLAMIVGFDVFLRYNTERELGWKRFIYPSTGAQLFWIPVWLLIMVLSFGYWCKNM